MNVMGPSFEPWVVMVLPPGGFLMIGLLLVGRNWREQLAARRRERAIREAAAVRSAPRAGAREGVLA
jgi:electron transport complex protein RnfE